MLPTKSMTASKSDLLQIEVYSLRARILELERAAHTAEMIARYKLRDGDDVDLRTGKIIRAEEKSED